MYRRVRELRTDHNLSQTEFAQILGMSQTGYSKYETGENDIPTEILIAIANYHRTSVDYLLGLTDEKKPYPKKRAL
ncbi:helix-turn-helix transcriptional regulator [Clostridium sp. KNHs216]|uniref:helix-turn-helix domain-containing protein n=1 Tax=Clostridium sp. KNHs216 TaxID=1550235 RepID=UPI0011508D38|nr:helix-turn-helix transcriptional regulator [Clostridium sp. KNHs216]TQI67596.1 helix-turn-helix protein [Clostridium sp. KNHs216]